MTFDHLDNKWLYYLQRSSSELSSYQKKIIPIDDHVAVSIAGLTSDARLLRYLQSGLFDSNCLERFA